MLRGRVPATPLRSVQAYVDLQNFGALPRGGGTFDQDGDLLEEMRYIASEVNRARQRAQDEDRREIERLRHRR